MIISGDNACLACLIHNPSKVKEVLINRDKKANYMKIIEKINIIKNIRFIDKKELQKIILVDVQNDIYPYLEKSLLDVLHNSGYQNIKFTKKIDFENLYQKSFN